VTIMKKTVSLVISFLFILVVAFNGLLLYGKVAQGKTSVLGYELRVVLSGSMSPTFDTGSIVAVKPEPFSDIRQGEIITYAHPDGYTVTHRVVTIRDGQLITKGDANNVADQAPVPASSVMGKVHFWLPYMGYAVSLIHSKVGMFLLLALPGCYLLIGSLRKVNRLAGEQEETSREQHAKVR